VRPGLARRQGIQGNAAKSIATISQLGKVGQGQSGPSTSEGIGRQSRGNEQESVGKGKLRNRFVVESWGEVEEGAVLQGEGSHHQSQRNSMAWSVGINQNRMEGVDMASTGSSVWVCLSLHLGEEDIDAEGKKRSWRARSHGKVTIWWRRTTTETGNSGDNLLQEGPMA